MFFFQMNAYFWSVLSSSWAAVILLLSFCFILLRWILGICPLMLEKFSLLLGYKNGSQARVNFSAVCTGARRVTTAHSVHICNWRTKMVCVFDGNSYLQLWFWPSFALTETWFWFKKKNTSFAHFILYEFIFNLKKGELRWHGSMSRMWLRLSFFIVFKTEQIRFLC